MMKFERLRRSEAGFSLIEILISIGILGISATVFTQYTQRIRANQQAAEFLRFRTQITSMLINSTDCKNIVGCVEGQLRELRDSEGRVLVNALGTSTYGPWQVQAKCQADKTLEVRLSSTANGKFRRNPLTNEELDLKTKSGVIFDEGMICGKLENNSQPKPMQILTIYSARCLINQGTCPLPQGYVGTSKHVCCEDGSDVPKPKCPNGTSELSSHWDRDGDWGADGSWVVMCR